jgi:glycosyltransferase involved in cell wall biosynthesis
VRVSLIATVRNEENTIAALLDSVLEQTRRPDEVVVNDCGCTDGTMTIVEQYCGRLPLRTTAGGSNIPQGRNVAIRAAQGPLVACTDAGLRLDPCWLEEIVAPLERGEAELVGGFFRADPRTPFERVLGAVAYPRLVEIDPAEFIPAGQSLAFTRALWEKVGGFPEGLPYCEDLVFTRQALALGFRKAFTPQALVHFRPRSSLAAFFRQYRNYAYGDGLANLWPRRHALRYGSYVLGLGLLVAGGWWPILWGILALAGAVYLVPYYRRLWPVLGELSPGWRVGAFFLLPLIRLVGDGAKMAGYPRGVWLRWRARPGHVT